MANIPDDFIQDVLARADIVSVVRQYVPSLKKAGSSYTGLCPFHDEKTPSFKVDPGKNLYYCFGCGAGGNTIGFVMRKSGMSYLDTLQELASQAGMELPQRTGADSEVDQRRRQIYDLLERATGFYREQLQGAGGRAARDYLQQRGIDEATISRFELGYAPSGWDSLRAALNVPEALLLQAGLVKRKSEGRSSYDVFRDRLMFPIRSHVRGRVVAFGGRVLRDEDKPKYLNSPESEVFSKRREWYGLHLQKSAAKRPDKVFVVEGYMDVVSMACHGLPEAVASLGTAVSDEQLQSLLRLFPAVVFCFDGDAAGGRAARRVLDNLLPILQARADMGFMFLPDGEDPDSLVRATGAGSLRERNVLGVLDFLRRELRGGEHAPEGEDNKARLLETARDALGKLRDPIVRGLVVENMAADFAMRAELVEQMMQPGPGSTSGNGTVASTTHAGGQDGSSLPLMRQAVALLVHKPQLALQHRDKIKAFPEVVEKKFFSEWLSVLDKNPDISSGAMLEHWRGSSYGERLQQLAAMPILLQDEIAMERELGAALQRLELVLCKKRINALLSHGLSVMNDADKEEWRLLQQHISESAAKWRR